jgi:putative mRNA 3-end processing factor
MKRSGLVTLTDRGLYCKQGDFYIDPWRPVKRAVVTHAHADHAYRGHGHYLVTEEGKGLFDIRLDLGAKITTQKYGEVLDVKGVEVSFHPAGHILGSAQVRVEHNGEIWVISGDYKLTPDPTCAPFEPVKCHHFVTEATFGLPIYRWTPPAQVYEDINEWWRRNIEREKASVIFAYSLGKSQRVMAGVDSSLGTIYTHGAVERLTQAYRDAGVGLPKTKYAGSVTGKKNFVSSLIVAPPSAQGSTWLRRFGPHFRVVRPRGLARAVDGD